MNAKELGNMPAYPTPGQDCVYASDGLTKREAFAMAAMQGLCMNQEWVENALKQSTLDAGALVAKGSVDVADRLIEELAKEQS